jgi:phosphatidylglycerophosphate synthase
MKDRHKALVHSITWYRILAAPILILLLTIDQPELFSALLVLSFFTDLIDGYLARKFRVASRFGALIDSIGDDLTVVAGVCGLAVWHWDFVHHHAVELLLLLSVFLFQAGSSLYRFGRTTSFHTWLAKVSAFLQGIFLIGSLYLNEPPSSLYYLTLSVTLIQLIEEIILVWLIPSLRSDVKGLYWVIRSKLGPKP